MNFLRDAYFYKSKGWSEKRAASSRLSGGRGEQKESKVRRRK